MSDETQRLLDRDHDSDETDEEEERPWKLLPLKTTEKSAWRHYTGVLLLITFAISIFIATLSWRQSSPGWLETVREHYGTPCLTAGALRDGSFGFKVTGRRKIDDPTKVELTDKFHLGSNTKAMTSTMLAGFIEEGLFSWNTTLPVAFPNLANSMHPSHRNTTLAMLATHRSGITDDWIGKNVSFWLSLYDESLPPMEGRRLVVEMALIQEAALPPGKQFAYSNTGYMILGHTMEVATGSPWEDLLIKRIFQPLNMMECGFGVPPEPDLDAVDNPWPHLDSSEGPIPIFPDRFSDNPPALGPAGTVHCPMEDYSKFLQLHIDGFHKRETPCLKNPESFYPLQHAPEGQDYTVGGWVQIESNEKRPTLRHAGSNGLNYVSAFMFLPLGMAFMSMTNVGGDAAANATFKIITDMVQNGSLP